MFARLPAQALCPRGQACWSKRGPRALSSCRPLAEALGHGLGGAGQLPRLKSGVQASHSPSVSFSGPPTSQGGWSPAHSFPGPGAQSAGHTGHSQGQVSTHITTTPSFPLRALPGTQTRLQSLFFLLPDGVSSSQPCWYRSTSASFQFTFNENCSSYRCIFDGFVG